MILIDYSPVCIAGAFAKTPDGQYPSKEDYRESLFRTLLAVKTKNQEKYGNNIVVALDQKPYWRKEIFPAYKGNRKKMDVVHWDIVNEVRDILIQSVPWKVISIPRAEADDIIAVLINTYATITQERFLIVSPDGDFKQLQTHENVDQIDIIRGKELIESNPKLFLQEKIIGGDVSDAIPNILSDADTHICPDKRQKRLITKNKEKWATMTPRLYCQDNMLDRYIQNKQLIDFSQIPEDIQREIVYQYTMVPTTIDRKLRQYFVKNRMPELADRALEFIK